MTSNQYQTIKTLADVQRFQDVSNGLHDGYITHVEYSNTGISCCGNSLKFDPAGTKLTIHVLVTSLPAHPSFEIIFHNILEWQIKENATEIIDFSVLFLDNGMLLWADDCSHNISDLKQGSYVISKSMEYRMLPLHQGGEYDEET